MNHSEQVQADATVLPVGGLRGYVTVPYSLIVQIFGPPNSPAIDSDKVNAEWLLRTPVGTAAVYDWKPEMPTDTPVEGVTDWHVAAESSAVMPYIAKALGVPTYTERCGAGLVIRETTATASGRRMHTTDALVEHLFNEEALWVPGGRPDHGGDARNMPLAFVPQLPLRIRRHPLNAVQTDVVGGRLTDPVRQDPDIYFVALAHLAHARGTCETCDPVWLSADDAWSEIPTYDDGGHASLFAAFTAAGSDEALLVHIDDVPPEMHEPDLSP
ncbi:Uncharacterised protein [Mycobacteroides abscessus subsp. abscessus]|nr:Uncharacterised protein [Mycobacteroides abscessus subsp. abscessus]